MGSDEPKGFFYQLGRLSLTVLGACFVLGFLIGTYKLIVGARPLTPANIISTLASLPLGALLLSAWRKPK